ncbi:MAG: hypothetical protein [Bacteriophage sp.]|nr:MAG: hypothetical protein [Bacteriophage sp.]
MKTQQYINEALNVIEALKNDRKATIASVRAYWESYVASEEPCLTIPAKARTKAQIVYQLENIIMWLNGFGRTDKYATPETAMFAQEAAMAEDLTRLVEAQRAAGLPVDEEGNDMREWCGNDIEAAHTEALEVDAEVNEWNEVKSTFTPGEMDYLHGEALKMDAVFSEHVRRFKYGIDHYECERKTKCAAHSDIVNAGYSLGWKPRDILKLIKACWSVGIAAAKRHRAEVVAMIAAAPAAGTMPGYEIPF